MRTLHLLDANPPLGALLLERLGGRTTRGLPVAEAFIVAGHLLRRLDDHLCLSAPRQRWRNRLAPLPAGAVQRYGELIALRDVEPSSGAEHAELLRLSNADEKRNAKRIAARVELAILRDLSLSGAAQCRVSVSLRGGGVL